MCCQSRQHSGVIRQYHYAGGTLEMHHAIIIDGCRQNVIKIENVTAVYVIEQNVKYSSACKF